MQTNNLFNGKSSSGVADNRSVLNTGQNTNGSAGGEIQTSTSVYSAIGQAMPAPPQETLEEVRVNTSMYDASEGSYSGAHITLQTRTGTNQYHGQAYEYHQTDAWNAAPFFFNQDSTLRSLGKTVPELKRNSFGVTYRRSDPRKTSSSSSPPIRASAFPTKTAPSPKPTFSPA